MSERDFEKAKKRHRFRSSRAWKYRTIKRFKQRAQKFRQNATTVDEALAWNKVVRWCKSIIEHYRNISKNGDIHLIHEEQYKCPHCEKLISFEKLEVI
jgi:hypothetical protein